MPRVGTAPNARVARAIEHARLNDPRHVVSAKDANAIARVVQDELERASDGEAARTSIGAALAGAPRPDPYKPAAGVLNVLGARVAATHAMPAFPADGKTADFEALTSAVVGALKQSFSFKRKNAGKDIAWDGPANLAWLAATSPPFAEQLSLDGLAYHRERGRDALTMLVTVHLQLAFEQGVRLSMSGEKLTSLKKGLIARANGDTSAPTVAELKTLLAQVEKGDTGTPTKKRAKLPSGRNGGTLERGAVPFHEADLLAPVAKAFAFAFDATPKGRESLRESLPDALGRSLSIGVEQGRRAAGEELERDVFTASMLLSLLESGASQQLVARFVDQLVDQLGGG